MKKDNKFSLLLIFICGILFIVGFLPIFENIVEVICLFVERTKGKLSKDISIVNKEISELNEAEEPICTNAIGFEVPTESEYFDCDDKNKRKVGF